MIPGFEAVVEARIKKAQAKGDFDNLPGSNKPLNFEDIHVPEEYRLAHKILKNSGFLPPEVAMQKKIKGVEQLLVTVGADSPERKRLQKKLNYLIVKLNTMRGGKSFSPLATTVYQKTIVNKIS